MLTCVILLQTKTLKKISTDKKNEFGFVMKPAFHFAVLIEHRTDSQVD